MPRGRRKIEIDGSKVETLAGIGGTLDEIGKKLGCSADTLQSRFKKELERGWANLRLNVKNAQYEMAVIKRNPTMLIWMGKQHLDQSDEGSAKKQAGGVGDQLEGFYKALMAGPAAPASEETQAQPATEEQPAASEGDVTKPAEPSGEGGVT